MLRDTLVSRAEKTEELLKHRSVSDRIQLDEIEYYTTDRFATPSDVQTESFESCSVGFTWERDRETVPADRRTADADPLDVAQLPPDLSLGTNVWFRLRFSIPESLSGKPVYLRFVTESIPAPESEDGGSRVESLCFKDGEPWQAFDGGHDKLLLTDEASGGEEFDLLIETGTTALWGQIDLESFRLAAAELVATRETVRELHYNFSVLNDLRKDIDDDNPNHGKILQGLYEASQAFDFKAEVDDVIEARAADALDVLEELKAELDSELSSYSLKTMGHAHIDLAWHWPWSETVRKSGRSFSTMLSLMKEYPEFTFIQSQPHLYEMAKDRYPSVFEGISEQVSADRWLAEAALWVESDVNVSGGEALARQYLYGKRYFREEFDVDPRITFIPDVFGYSPSLPGIAQAADCPYFLTQKISWNDTNEFPHNTFYWEGIDGSQVLSHFPPADTYNGMMEVEEVRDSVTELEENDVLDESVYLIGWGDGGGGTSREMLERGRVIDDIGSLPDIEFGSMEQFFEDIEADGDALDTWVGELYLEKHRGTLTSQAKSKRNNRKGEFALRDAELWSSLAAVEADSFEYPDDAIERAWKILLFNQFHDILPGSSITEVYADADRDYADVLETAADETERAVDALTDSTDASDTICVTNPVSWERDTVVSVPAESVSVDGEDLVAETPAGTEPVQYSADGNSLLLNATSLPSLGATTVEISERADSPSNPLTASTDHVENDHLKVTFRDDGTISVWDKDRDRSVLESPGNRLVLYEDLPAEWNAWDIEQDMYERGEQLPEPVDRAVLETGPVRAVVRQTYEFGDSTLEQDIILARDSGRIDFRTTVDWQEEEMFLKTHFPADVHTNTADYDVQFGNYERSTHENTTWDEAKFEEPHQKWVDVSEPGYGVAVLNDSKYGVHVDGTDVSLSLLRSPVFPDPDADTGTQEFRYALYPHEGDFRTGGVIEEGYDLNVSETVQPVETPTELSLCEVEGDGVVVESVKRAEDDPDALVVRLYEAWGRHTSVDLSFEFTPASVTEVNLIEDELAELEAVDPIPLEFDPYEITSIRVELPN